VKTARVSAASLLEQLSKAYDEEHQRLDPADAKWLATVRRSGTTADKLAAWTVVIQENLPANLRSLMAVLQLCSLKGKRQAAQAIEVRPGKLRVELTCPAPASSPHFSTAFGATGTALRLKARFCPDPKSASTTRKLCGGKYCGAGPLRLALINSNLVLQTADSRQGQRRELASRSVSSPASMGVCIRNNLAQVMCELFGGVVLPERKLKYLFEQPLHLLPEAALKGDVRNKVRASHPRRSPCPPSAPCRHRAARRAQTAASDRFRCICPPPAVASTASPPFAQGRWSR
jgi:hypothetical protein